ncbi:MAG: tRNA (adenosine(37)-N6)-threonylcarbamoyltransferase complex ATPase subunit type 1 TsaE, partial [Pseudomonadota bacterium]
AQSEQPEPPAVLTGLREPDVLVVAELFSLAIQVGDVIALSGDLGAGKTTFARGLIRALMREGQTSPSSHQGEVPSPTFTLAQTYHDLRVPITHFDLYRLGAPEEVDELGLDAAVAQGAALIEWPENAETHLPPATFVISFCEDGDLRQLELIAPGGANDRLKRVCAAFSCLSDAKTHIGDTPRLTHLYGDASARTYAQIDVRPDAEAGADTGLGDNGEGGNGPTALLMDWPVQPDGPPVRNGLPYSRIAHIAEDMPPFLGIADALSRSGFAVPKIYSVDTDAGFMVLEDFGPGVFGALLAQGAAQEPLWRNALDVLVAMRRVVPPRVLTAPQLSRDVSLPRYDRAALTIEVELLLDWYWPMVHGAAAPDAVRADFLAAWEAPFRVIEAEPDAWVLRDFHSPNLINRPGQTGLKRTGLIDFQDAVRGPAAYDLVSLLQDARLDVSEELETELMADYLTRAQRDDPAFDATHFKAVYAAVGAQRCTKILGIFARLSQRDGKPKYLAHLPRLWGYLQRNLSHPAGREFAGLADLATWYDTAFPGHVRRAHHGPPTA